MAPPMKPSTIRKSNTHVLFSRRRAQKTNCGGVKWFQPNIVWFTLDSVTVTSSVFGISNAEGQSSALPAQDTLLSSCCIYRLRSVVDPRHTIRVPNPVPVRCVSMLSEGSTITLCCVQTPLLIQQLTHDRLRLLASNDCKKLPGALQNRSNLIDIQLDRLSAHQ